LPAMTGLATIVDVPRSRGDRRGGSARPAVHRVCETFRLPSVRDLSAPASARLDAEERALHRFRSRTFDELHAVEDVRSIREPLRYTSG
jgi:hypothetical protein